MYEIYDGDTDIKIGIKLETNYTIINIVMTTLLLNKFRPFFII